MSPRTRARSWAAAFLLCLLPVACGPGESVDEHGTAGLANPASVHCDEQGGAVEITEDEAGGQLGYCVFPDGSRCEEWAFYRGECRPRS